MDGKWCQWCVDIFKFIRIGEDGDCFARFWRAQKSRILKLDSLSKESQRFAGSPMSDAWTYNRRCTYLESLSVIVSSIIFAALMSRYACLCVHVIVSQVIYSASSLHPEDMFPVKKSHIGF